MTEAVDAFEAVEEVESERTALVSCVRSVFDAERERAMASAGMSAGKCFSGMRERYLVKGV